MSEQFTGRIGTMLYVADLEYSVVFYRDVLGFRFKGFWDEANRRVVQDYREAGSPSYAEVSAGGNGVGLQAASDRRAGGAEHNLYVENIADYHHRVTAAGASASQPERQPWGATMFTLSDPDGHVWNFIEAPSSRER
jgi:uncharacterized glyoxalase superfamily protein PhnB